MGRFRDPAEKGSSGPSFPGVYLTWNAQSGTFRGAEKTDQGWQSVDVKNINSIILEPSLYRVTGESQDKRIKLWSNFAKGYTHDELKVMATTKGADKRSHELLAEGVWNEVKETPLPQNMPRMRYTKCVMVAIIKADYSVYDREKGKPGEFKERDFSDDYQIAVLQLRGHAIILSEGKGKDRKPVHGVSWAGSLLTLKDDNGGIMAENNIDGCYLGCFDTYESKSAKGDVWLQPMFKLRRESVLPEEVLGKADEKYTVVKEYLEAHWGHEDYFAEDEPDTPDDTDEGMSDGIEADNLGPKGKKEMF